MTTIIRPAPRRYGFLDAPLHDSASEAAAEPLTPAGTWVHRRKRVSRAIADIIANLAGLGGEVR
jgi:hypothetical protein